MVRSMKMKLFAAINVLSIALFVIGLHTSAQELRRSGFLGIVTVALTEDARKQLQPNETGILVQSVVEGGSAKDSGIQANDIITQVNDHKIIDVNDFVQTAKNLRAGDSATIHIRRNSASLTKQLLVKPRPYESAPDVDTLYKAVTVDDSLRRVIVTVPKTQGKHPAVLYINGIGWCSQESVNLQSNDAKLR